MNTSKWAAASVLLALGLFLLRPGGDLGRSAFAGEAIPGVDDPRTIAWTTTYYVRVTGGDGKKTWLKEERRLHAYRHPGHYRETFLDEAGQPRMVEITDVRAGRMLQVDLKEKKAVLKFPFGQPDVRGPFAWVGEALRDRMVARVLPVKSISLHGHKEIDGAPANVVRAMISRGDDLGYGRHDFFFDEKSRRLVGIYVTNENDFDPETAPERKQPAEGKGSMFRPVASLEHEIVLDPKLDASDFGLDPPAGFAYQAMARPTITEDEFAAYLGAAARFNDGVFPDSPYGAFDGDRFNAASTKAASARTPAEDDMIRLHDKFLMREIYRPPARQFVDDHAEPGSFHYVGAGTRVGQADRIVFWYTTRSDRKLRGLFADLSVRDVKPSELPLDLKAGP